MTKLIAFRSAVCVALCLLGGNAVANIIYTISLPPTGNVTVSGTFTTNGNLGTLTAVDFLDWDVTVLSPSLGSSNILGPGHGTFANTTLARFDGIFATATTLFMAPPAVLDLEGSASGPNCSSTFAIVTPVPPGGFAEQLKVCTTLGFTAPQIGLPQSGVFLATGGVTVPSTVPEPSTLGLLCAGLLGLAFARQSHTPGAYSAVRA